MSAWLSPRVRLGVSVSVAGVIACTLLLTAVRSDYDQPPGYVGTPEIEPLGAPAAPPSSPLTPIPALPQAVVTALGLRPSDSSIDALPGTAASMSSLADFELDVLTMPDAGESTELTDRDSELSSLQLTPDGFGEFVFAQPAIHFDWKGCEACERPGPTNLVPWGGVGLPGSGGGGPAGASFLPELGNPSPVEIPVFEEFPPPGGNPPGGNPPEGNPPEGNPPEGDPTPDPPDDEPRPNPPGVPVPEPSTVVLMGAALSLMIGGTRARKRQR